jgi:hypothetical protein
MKGELHNYFTIQFFKQEAKMYVGFHIRTDVPNNNIHECEEFEEQKQG